jgi:hypothetical protein
MAAGAVTVDVCAGSCGGIWFDAFELKKVDEHAESAGDILLEIARNPATCVDLTRKRICPRCPGIVLMRHFFSRARRVQVDECPACGGFWLDAGELSSIRAEKALHEEKREAAKELVRRLAVRYVPEDR